MRRNEKTILKKNIYILKIINKKKKKNDNNINKKF